MQQFVGLYKHSLTSIIHVSRIECLETKKEASVYRELYAVYIYLLREMMKFSMKLPSSIRNGRNELIESDDWARRSENRFSLIVSKTIANVNKMRVNLYLQKRKTWCWQYWNQSGFRLYDWTKSSKQFHILSLQLLRLSYHVRKMAHYVYSCAFCRNKNPSRWHIRLDLKPIEA